MRRVVFLPSSFADCDHWAKNDKRLSGKILRLIVEIASTPFTGTGRPEPLKHSSANTWSRELDDFNRIVYVVYDDRIEIKHCRGHYDN